MDVTLSGSLSGGPELLALSLRRGARILRFFELDILLARSSELFSWDEFLSFLLEERDSVAEYIVAN